MYTNKLRFVEDEPIADVAERKRRLRQYMKNRRAENVNRDVKEVLLCERLLSVLEGFEGKMTWAGTRRSVFIYLSFSSEASTDELIERLLEKGYSVFCPRMENGEMVAAAYGEDFTLSSTGIREPVGAVLTETPTYIVLPLLAADVAGNRLGYGKGNYDAYLAKHPDAKRIGYCFDFQILREVPREETDEALDVVVTEQRTIYTSARNIR